MRFYISTSIAYINAKPHIGFALESVQADVLTRYHRLRGDETFFLTGTDEHGTKIVQTAREAGTTPQALADENSTKFRALKELLHLLPDDFIRTSEDRHKKGVVQLWQALAASGDLYKKSYTGAYCMGCEAFVTEKDLLDGMCPNHKQKPQVLSEENYFFRLSKYSAQITEAIASDRLKILPVERKNEILALLKEGLNDVSFSRPAAVLQWGVPVPDDPAHVMYVWCDALTNYMTGVGYGTDEKLYKKWWPAQVHLIGKDILRFHAGVWIGMLLSAKLPLPEAIYVHGFVTSEGQKMSKSLGNVVDPVQVVEEWGIDALRYYLLREIPTTGDGDFSATRFAALYEGELAHGLGNLVNRVISMTERYLDGVIPAIPADSSFASRVADFWKAYMEAIAAFDLKVAMEQVMSLVSDVNKEIALKEPWKMAKDPANKQSLADALGVWLEVVRHIGVALTPFLPQTAAAILKQVDCTVHEKSWQDLTKWGGLLPGQHVTKLPPLFPVHTPAS